MTGSAGICALYTYVRLAPVQTDGWTRAPVRVNDGGEREWGGEAGGGAPHRLTSLNLKVPEV